MAFADAARALSGLAGALLGWRPDEFWRATPMELEAILNAMAPPDARALDAATLQKLKEIFPDG